MGLRELLELATFNNPGDAREPARQRGPSLIRRRGDQSDLLRVFARSLV